MKSSIALTTYNGSKYIIELLDSLKNQTKKPDEVIIVDDMSTDNTIAIVENYINTNGLYNWKIIKNEKNLGWKRNFRKAMGLSNGDIIFFCDQDDIWHDDKIEVMCNAFETNSNIQVLVSNYVLLSQGNHQTKKQKGSERDDGTVEQLKGFNRIGTISRPGCTFAFSKKIQELIQSADNVDCAHDHVVYNLGLITNSLYIINRQLIDFRRHTSNASTYKMRFGKNRKSIEARERVEICEILSEYCKRTKNQTAYEAVEKRKSFYSTRMNIFDDGNLFQMIGFVIAHMSQYRSMRDIVVDLIAMVR